MCLGTVAVLLLNAMDVLSVEVLCWIGRVYDLPQNVRVVPVIPVCI